MADALEDEGVIVWVLDVSQAWPGKSRIAKTIRIDTYPTKLENFPMNESVIFDLSRLYMNQQREVVTALCKALFNYKVNLPKSKRRWHFIMFEECQLYLKQSSMRSNASAEVLRLITVGRNYKIRYGLITQFPSSVDKLPVKMTKQRYFGYTDEPNDKAYLSSFIGKDRAEELETMTVGQFYYKKGRQIEKISTPEYKRKIEQIEEIQPQKPVRKIIPPYVPTKKSDNSSFGFGVLAIFVIVALAWICSKL